MNGNVKFFNENKGFGFITTEEGKDLFFHITDVENQEVLKDNDSVKFDVTNGDRGPKATRVVKV